MYEELQCLLPETAEHNKQDNVSHGLSAQCCSHHGILPLTGYLTLWIGFLFLPDKPLAFSGVTGDAIMAHVLSKICFPVNVVYLF